MEKYSCCIGLILNSAYGFDCPTSRQIKPLKTTGMSLEMEYNLSIWKVGVFSLLKEDQIEKGYDCSSGKNYLR